MADVNGKVQVAPPLTEDDWKWLRSVWLSEWGGETMITKGKVRHMQDLDAVIAWDDRVRVGAATYCLGTEECELMSLNSSVEGLGIGSTLISAVEQTVRKAGIGRIWLITSNNHRFRWRGITIYQFTMNSNLRNVFDYTSDIGPV